MSFPQQLEHLDEVIHDPGGTAGDAGGDEQSLAPAAATGLEEDADQFLGLEQRAWHRAIPSHGAVVAVVATGVGHEDAEERHPCAGAGAEVANVERAECADVVRNLRPSPGTRM